MRLPTDCAPPGAPRTGATAAPEARPAPAAAGTAEPPRRPAAGRANAPSNRDVAIYRAYRRTSSEGMAKPDPDGGAKRDGSGTCRPRD
ncbi:hypothetical protein GCM10010106_35050 [Thermopolyspora flexuosa]|nr:hypothetical protein GCM10010106_35050 [Thermopolyspora flexuosa]